MSMTVEHAARPFFGRAYMSRPLRQSRGLDWIDLALIAMFFAGIYTNYPIPVSKTVPFPAGWSYIGTRSLAHDRPSRRQARM